MADEDAAEAGQPQESVGARLARAREAAGLSRAQIAAQTRIPERHLAAIEAGNFAALPARTYAVGFSRSYAKVVGLDEAEITALVRAELAEQEPETPYRPAQTFEPGDPARVPGSRLAWIAALGAVAVILAGFVFWRSYYVPGGELPSLLRDEPPPSAAPSLATAPAPAASGPVVFTAQEDAIWVKFYDGAGNQLLQKELARGESWTVPDGASDVKLWTARPEALSITIGGQQVAPLSDVQRMMKDVPVSAAALLARGSQGAVIPPDPQAAATPARQPRRVSRPVRRQVRDVAPSTQAPTPAPTAPVTAAPGPSPTSS